MILQTKSELSHKNITSPQIVDIQTHVDDRGCLGVVEALPDAGFVFKRLYFLYANSGDALRGQHAHKKLWQYMIALHGQFDIILKGKNKTIEFTLSSPKQGLIVPPGYWRDLKNFSSDAVCLVGASEEYDENDYIREYNAFIEWENQQD